MCSPDFNPVDFYYHYICVMMWVLLNTLVAIIKVFFGIAIDTKNIRWRYRKYKNDVGTYSDRLN